MSATIYCRRTWTGVFAFLSGLLVLGRAAPAPVRAGEAHYVLVYASQRIPNNPDYSHSAATFVRATWVDHRPGSGPGAITVEAHTISWLPHSGRVRTLALLPECGRNYGLHETIRLALATDQRVSLWGPYHVHPDLYGLALRRIGELNSGNVRYKTNDAGHRSDRVSNCVHAVSAVVDGHRLYVASPGWGEVASYAVLRRMEPWVIDGDRTHDWLVPALGLSAYPIYYRAWEPPHSGAFVGPVYRLFGGERGLEPSYGPPPMRGR